jgi:N-acetylglutamate synthase-like GNAT family acetyltransferase
MAAPDHSEIIYRTDITPDIDDIINLYGASGYFPIVDKSDRKRIEMLHNNAQIIVTAWHQGLLVGLARAISDFCYCCSLSDLCVDNDYQRKGIGRVLVETTKMKAGSACKLILDSSISSMGFYKKIGMQHIDSAFVISRDQ